MIPRFSLLLSLICLFNWVSGIRSHPATLYGDFVDYATPSHSTHEPPVPMGLTWFVIIFY